MTNKLDYEIISSGSQNGNCFRIENILIDIGIKFDDLKDEISKHKIKAIFISHRHSDHCVPATYHQISKRFPYIKFIINQDVADKLHEEIKEKFNNIVVIKDGTNVKIPSNDNSYRSLVINVFHTDHDINILSNGYFGTKISYSGNDLKFVFATDFWNVNNLPKEKLDYIFLEANHNERTLKLATEAFDLPEWSLSGSKRHLSEEISYQYYVTHRKQNTVYIPLHKSERFYNEFEDNFSLNDLQKAREKEKQEETVQKRNSMSNDDESIFSFGSTDSFFDDF